MTPALAVMLGAAIPNFPPPYWWYADTLVGLGAATTPALEGPTIVFAADVAERPFGGSLSMGMSLRADVDTRGLWNVITPGVFAKVDLTYVILTAFWSIRHPADFPVRLVAGIGVGLAVSQSYFDETSSGVDAYQAHTAYTLARPQLSPTLDIEYPLPFAKRHYTVVVRGTFDAPINFTTIFRFGVLAGISVSWDHIVDPG